MEIKIHSAEDPSECVASTNSKNNIELYDMNSIRSTLTLPLNQMAIPIYTAPPSHEEVETGGQFLFQNFIQEEIEQEGFHHVLEDETGAFGDVGFFGGAQSASAASTPEGYSNITLQQVGQNIRDLADAFRKSEERPLIRRQADQVDLDRINQESFFIILEEVFKNGIDRQYLIALFFFCSDVLVRCLRREMKQLGMQLFLWSSKFVLERVCKWVYEHGGWSKVLKSAWTGFKELAFVGACVAIMYIGYVSFRSK